jgi:hypothetical protein
VADVVESDADNDPLDPQAGTPLAWQANTGWVNPETPASQPFQGFPLSPIAR